MTPVLEVDNLRVTFGGRVASVRGISIKVQRGETHCLVGESGCGKSVSALAVMGLLALIVFAGYAWSRVLPTITLPQSQTKS